MELPYDQLKTEIETLLTKTKIMILATSCNDRVTARSMLIVNNGIDIYFQTDRYFLKCEQMRQNSNVAVYVNNIQVEGIAGNCGHPMDNGNTHFRQLYKARHEGSYEAYSSLKNEIVFMVQPALITLWKYIDAKPCRDILQCDKCKALREFYEPE